MLFELDNLEREHKAILHTVKKYYDKYQDRNSISIDELRVFFFHENPAIKDKSIYNVLFDQIATLDISNNDVISMALDHVAEYHVSSKAMAMLAAYLSGDSKHGISTLMPMIEEYQSLVVGVGDENPDECTDDLHDIMAEIQREGLNWRLSFLNEAIGPVYPGTLGHVLARPETGKTAFCIDVAAYWAWQLRETDESVLYLSNEENVKRTRARAYASLLGVPVPTLLTKSVDGVRERFNKLGGKNLRFVNQVTSIDKVEQNIIRYRPKVVIVDQGPKVSIPGNYSSVEVRQIIYNKYRNYADKYNNIFLSVGQADAKAENKKWLTYNHADGSKVGIPGECDYIIGVGRDENDMNPDYRYFCLSKNKLGSTLGKWTARIETAVSRYQTV